MVKLRFVSIALFVLTSGCASYGTIQNAPVGESAPPKNYSLEAWSQGTGGWERPNDSGRMQLILAFSGGGTRAAALSYGVLKAMRDTNVKIEGQPTRLLDEIDMITSVSGGSFTAAYYGLHGEKIFTDFEDVFLRRDVEGALKAMLFNPFRWFGSTGRTEWAVEYYQDQIFHGATFADMVQPGRPLILINATDLGNGPRFSFIQEYFNLLCSDLSSYPVARAVTASSAVPVVFQPIVIENYAHCGTAPPDFLLAAEQRAATNAGMRLVVEELESYFDKDQAKFAHFVDGGISDNLGVRAVYEIIEITGGATAYAKRFARVPPRRLVVIAIDGSTDPYPVMNESNKAPSLLETVGAMSDIQLHRYNVTTIELMKYSMARWAKESSTPQRPVTPYFIYLSFPDLKDAEQRKFFDSLPTSFNLTDEQVDRLIDVGNQLLRENPEFQRLMSDLKGN